MAEMKSRSGKKAKRYKVELTPLSAMFWGTFIFFLLTWIFVLGILVGRGFLPGNVTTISDLKGQIRKLQDMVSHEEGYKSKAPKEPDPAPKLAFYEKLSTKKEEIKKDRKPVKEPANPKVVVAPKKAEVPKKRADDSKLEDIVETLKKESEPLTADILYTVQLASLRDRDKAAKMIDGLIEKGYDAYYYEAKVKDKTYFRIRCGKFTTRNEAGDYARRLAEGAGVKGFVSRLE